jgi:hypothetical protein
VSTFSPNLKGMSQTINYDFRSGAPGRNVTTGNDDPDATKCSGILNGKAVSGVPIKATVAGTGELSCAMGSGTGKGALAFPDGSTFPFDFTFNAMLTEVDFTATFSNGAAATGHASFQKYAPPDTPIACAGDGIKSLGFDATTNQPNQAIVGTKPDPPAAGRTPTNGSSAPTNRSTTNKLSKAAKRKACQKKAKKNAKKIKNKKKQKKALKKALKKCKKIK